MVILHWKDIAGKAPFHAVRGSPPRARGAVSYHGHDFAEIFWIDTGRSTHQINGDSVPLGPGSLVFIRPGDCHGINPIGIGETKLTNIAFPQETVAFLGQRYFAGQSTAFWHTGNLPATRQVEPSQLRRLNRWADALSESPREALYIERFLLNVLVELNLEVSDAPLDEAPEWLSQACLLIQKPDQFSKGVEHFLRLCGRSREHVARTVQHHLGMTPTAYVNNVRITYAMRQLEMANNEIIQIALDCGIANLSHFYSLFRAQTGMTPRAYRISHQKPL
jgi:AraC family cel operon transcriptional repressor